MNDPYFPITDAIPAPAYTGAGRRTKYPYAKLEIGQSFFAEADAIDSSAWGRKTGYKFTQRRVHENGVKGIRVWRVA